MSTTVLSVVLGACGMLGWGVYDFLGGVLSRRLGSFVPLLWSQLVGAVTIVAVALAMGTRWHVGAGSLALVVLAAALYCGGYLSFFAGFEKGEVSLVAATMNLWAIVTMSVAFAFMGQRLSGSQVAGAALILCGAVLASIRWADVRRSGLTLSAGIRETLVGAVLFGLYWNVSEVVSEDLGWLSTTVLVKIVVVAVLLPVALLGRRRSSGAVPLSTGAVLVGMGLVEVAAVGAVNYGLVVGDAILVTPVASALSVVTIGLAVAVLGERVSRLQAVGIAAALTGIVVTAL